MGTIYVGLKLDTIFALNLIIESMNPSNRLIEKERFTDSSNLRQIENSIHTTFTDWGYLDVAMAVHVLLTYPKLIAVAALN